MKLTKHDIQILMAGEISVEQAHVIYATKWWLSNEWTSEEIARYQLNQGKLCTDFSAFHRACEQALRRPIYTHEFAKPENLIAELNGRKKSPTLLEIIRQL